MKIYRIEHRDTRDGMWYNYDGTYNGFIFNLTEGKARNFPMDYHSRYSKENLNWISGVKDKEQLLEWFSLLDIKELLENGYGLFGFMCDKYIIEESQVLFPRESVYLRKEISIQTLYIDDEYTITL